MQSEEQTRVTVKIYGKTYKFKGEPGTPQQYIYDVARHVDTRMNNIGKSNPTLDLPRIAVLAAVHVTDEWLKLQRQDEGKQEERDSRVRQLEELQMQFMQRIRELEAENERLTTELAQRDSKASDAQKQSQALQANSDKLRQQLKELEPLQKQREQLQKDHVELQGNMRQLQETHEEMKESHIKLQEEYEKLKSEFNEWIHLAEEELT